MRSFKSNENIHKKEGGSYYVVSANKASSVTLQSPGNESQRKHTVILRISNRQSIQRLRKNVEWGLKIKVNEQNKVIQISQLADDTTLFFTNEEAIINGLKLVDDFGNVSGLKLNKDKMDDLWLGRVGNRKDNMANINWDKSNIKALGVHFGYDKKEVERKNGKVRLLA